MPQTVKTHALRRMTRPSTRLPARLRALQCSFPSSSTRYVCIQCRYRASLQQASSSRPRITPYSGPSLRRTYASGPIERFQDTVTKNISKRLFKKGEGPVEQDLTQPKDEEVVAQRPIQDAMPPVDDSEYTPAVSGEELERIGGPTGWWEQAWDDEHHFQGSNIRFMRPTPLRKSSEIQSAVERALVEAVLLRQEPQGSPLRSAIQRALKESKTLRPESKRLRRRISVMNTPRPSDVPEIKDFELRQTQDGVIKLQWGRQEDKENICNFLARSLEKSMEAKESEEETINETMAEDEMGAQQETATLAHPEKDEPVTTASASITDADEPQVPREWDAPAIVGAETDQIIDGLPVNEDPPAPEPHGSSHKERNKVLFPNFRGDIRLTDPELKFAVIKRAMQLTGIRIPDPAIQLIKSTEDLHKEFVQKPKPKKLADFLARPAKRRGVEPLISLPNVQVLPTKYRPSMAEGALGRQKIIEKRLEEHGIEEPWKETMERIEAYERRRLLRNGSAVHDREPVLDEMMAGDAIDAAISEGKARELDAMGQPQMR